MAEYIAPHPGIEVSGISMRTIFRAMGPHAGIAQKCFSERGIRELAPDGWYPLQDVLDALKAVAQASGNNTLLEIGKKIPEGVPWPNEPKTLEEGLTSIDIAYHLNHRLDGEVMVDSSTGDMRGGIGHFRCMPQGKREVVVICDTPYPSELDRGVVLSVARRSAPHGFKTLIQVALDESKPCRRRGAESCTFVVTW